MHQIQVNGRKKEEKKSSHKLTSADNTHTYYTVPYKLPKQTNQLKSKYAMPYLYMYTLQCKTGPMCLCLYVRAKLV